MPSTNTHRDVGDDAIDLRMMRVALTQARLAADIGEVPVGAVVYAGSQVLAASHNLRESTNDPTAHAEVLALREAASAVGGWRLSGCSIAVTLEPCPMCAGALVNARVDRLVYGAHDPKMGSVRSLHELCDDTRFNHRVAVRCGVLSEECGALLSEFFRHRRANAQPDIPAQTH